MTLPPDPDGRNRERASWANFAVAAFRVSTGTDREDALTDLLADLMHLCDQEEKWSDFDCELERARGHYQEETSHG